MMNDSYREIAKDWSVQRLKEEFWYWEREIRDSRTKPIDSRQGDSQYGKARKKLIEIAELIKERTDDDDLYMEDIEGNYHPWSYYL